MSSPTSQTHEEATDATNERRSRRSGRVSRKPELYIEEAPAASKRKRDAADDDQLDEDEESDEEEESEPGEEELREQKARARKAKAAAPKKPAAKRSKTNGTSVALPVRAGAKKGRSKKAKGVDEAAAEEVGGLYAEVFARGKTLEEAAEGWLAAFNEHESGALTDLVNFVLRSAGCDLEVSVEDIEDPDNCAGRLSDLQDEFQAQNVSEYPIIAKGKGTAAFKDSLTGFFHTLTKAIHTTNVLFANPELIENMQVWFGTMSAAQNRPFRHTATVVSLTIITALCEVGSELAEEASKALRHSETQKKGKNANKTRVSELQNYSKQAKANQEKLDSTVKDWFETVYIHRYRDVDPHIRVDCTKAIGEWIVVYPDLFFNGKHLRYMGWVLSDTNHSTRLEAIKQLHRLYADKNKLGGLKAFTERFRGRMVEMATKDAESSVRAAAVELLDDLREGGLLEPDDIDAIGRLIFDAEPRVRKSVVGFFAESINDAYEAKVDILGGQEALEEIIGEESDSFDSPCHEWIKFKCLAEGLDSYDSADGPMPSNVEKGPGQGAYLLHAGTTDSRFMIAADTLHDQIDEVREWEKLAGYLLYDTSVEDQNGDAAGGESQLKQELRLTENEEVILLEVLNSSVKQAVASLVEAHSDKKTKKTKKQKEDAEEMQEQAARHLANLIPRLLKKFGESPQTAASTLRLGRVLSLEAFQEFRQDSSTYAALLNDFNKQFLSHSNEEVLAEASRALLRAKSYHELGDVPDERIDSLWEDTISTFNTITHGKDLETRGLLSTTVLDALSKTVLRLEKLSSISNPVEYFETEPSAPATARPEIPEPSPPIDSLIALINRAASPKGSDPETAALDDALAMHASRTVTFYFMWRIPAFIKSLQTTALPDVELENLAMRRDAYVNALGAVLKTRPVNDELSVIVSGMLLDAHTIMATLRQVTTDKNGDEYLVLALEMDAVLQKRILRVFGAAEAAFAKATGKHVEVEAENSQAQESEEDDNEEPADPIDADPESEDEAEEEADAEGDDEQTQASQAKRVAKLQNSLLAEQRLCELASKLVLAILGRMVNVVVVKQRLERNKTRLGHNFKLVLEHLDAQTKGKKGKGKAAAAKTGAQQPKAKTAAPQQKSTEVVAEDDEDEEEDEEAVRAREIQEDDEMVDEPEGGNQEEEAQDEVAADTESVIGD
ncbi:STAG-domain-containing protein, partial [Aureobasidium melanogenum]